MDAKQIEDSIAYCGLLCCLCQPAHVCSCRSSHICRKRLSAEGCYQYNCCTAKGLNGCWECPDAPCGIDMLAEGKIKLRAFIACIQEDGLDRFSAYIARNANHGIVYHRKGFLGDYDLESEADVLKLLRIGSR